MSRLNVGSINGQALGGTRNFVINPDFAIDQRESGTVTAGAEWVADRWIFGQSGATFEATNNYIATGERATLFGNEIAPPISHLRCKVTASSAASDYVLVHHRIEDVDQLAGREVTIGFWARNNETADHDISVELEQLFGTGGSPSAGITSIGINKYTLPGGGGNFVHYSHTATLPSISGKTLGSDNNDYVSLNFWFSAGSDFSARTDTLGHQVHSDGIGIDISGVQLELGSVATPREYRPLSTEQLLCQRYYDRFNSYTYEEANLGGATVQYSVAFQNPVPMRKLPTVSVVSETNVNCNNATSFTMQSPSEGFYLIPWTNANTVAGRSKNLKIALEAEL